MPPTEGPAWGGQVGIFLPSASCLVVGRSFGERVLFLLKMRKLEFKAGKALTSERPL